MIIRLVSPLLKLAQKLILPSRTPLDIQAAFSSEPYQTDLAMAVTKRAREAKGLGLTDTNNPLQAVAKIFSMPHLTHTWNDIKEY